MSKAKLRRGDSELVAFGQMGGALCSGTAKVTVPAGLSVVAVTSLANTTKIPNGASGFPQTTNQAIPAGITVYGRWDSDPNDEFALEAGTAIVYFG